MIRVDTNHGVRVMIRADTNHGVMRKARNNAFYTLLQALEGTELNSHYAFTRFGNPPFFTITHRKKSLKIHIQESMPPLLNKKDNCRQYELILLQFNDMGICEAYSMQTTQWLSKKERAEQVFIFNGAPGARYYVLCQHLKRRC